MLSTTRELLDAQETVTIRLATLQSILSDMEQAACDRNCGYVLDLIDELRNYIPELED